MKKKLLFSVLLLLIMLLFTVTAVHAYFTTIYKQTQTSAVEVYSTTMPNVIVQNSRKLQIDILNIDMQEDLIDTNTPIKTDSDYIKITSTLSENGGYSELFYEIYYIPEQVFTRSNENVIGSNGKYANEFTIMFETKMTNKVATYDLANITDKTLVYKDSFIVSGTSAVAVEEILTTISFYNQDFNQDDNAGVIFGGDVIVEVTEVTYINS